MTTLLEAYRDANRVHSIFSEIRKIDTRLNNHLHLLYVWPLILTYLAINGGRDCQIIFDVTDNVHLHREINSWYEITILVCINVLTYWIKYLFLCLFRFLFELPSCGYRDNWGNVSRFLETTTLNPIATIGLEMVVEPDFKLKTLNWYCLLQESFFIFLFLFTYY